MPIFKAKNEDFFKKWSPEMAYVLGFFAADGNMMRHKNGGCYIELTSNDLEILEKIKKVMDFDNKISLRTRNSGISYRIQIGSKVLFEDLTKLGFTPNKSKTIKFPRVPTRFMKDFIRGYFDGDGCAHLGKHWAKDRNKLRWVFNMRFCSGSPDFLEDLWRKLKKSGIEGGYLYDKQGKGYDLVFSWKKGISLCKFMYNNVSSDMYLNRKYEIFQRALKII
ncbi:MAG: LAGLIDADG family homing endonuclease [Candidatus Taylorbacteria bacterium]|nr:LAGLIDADG family homing endonuclease [Candidatus Taylorbacteria bacterium]